MMPNDQDPIPMLIWCPECSERHVDVGEYFRKPHHTHACQSCGNVWRPAIVATVGVQFLPGFKNDAESPTLPSRAPVQCSSSWYFPKRNRRVDAHGPGTITWDEHMAVFAEYSRTHSGNQTAERIAERGGFGYDELKFFLGHEPTTWEPR